MSSYTSRDESQQIAAWQLRGPTTTRSFYTIRGLVSPTRRILQARGYVSTDRSVATALPSTITQSDARLLCRWPYGRCRGRPGPRSHPAYQAVGARATPRPRLTRVRHYIERVGGTLTRCYRKWCSLNTHSVVKCSYFVYIYYTFWLHEFRLNVAV
jgi:hypothetical protein